MRRRDAKIETLHLRQQVRPTMVSAALSLAVHATLLVLATTVACLPGGNRADLIRVWLVGGGTPATEGAGNPVQLPVALPPPPAPVRQSPQHQVDPRRHDHPESRTRSDRPVPRALTVSADAPDGTRPDSGGSGADGIAGTGVGATAAAGAGAGSGGAGSTGAGAGDDQRAYCVYCPEPRYPLIARARGWQGTVDVGLLVLADGSVDSANLRRSSGYGVLDAAAIAVARRSHFSPPAANGLAAPLRGRIEYRFELTTTH